eukprot:Opistho-2@82233
MPSALRRFAAEAIPAFRVLQFNCLADHLSNAFPLVDAKWLSWEHRSELIVGEIIRVDADFVCLEEVDHFADVLEPALASRGYTGFFKQKPGGVDGCALFYRQSAAEMLCVEEVEYADIAAMPGASQVAVVGSFRLVPSLRHVCVAVTHLKAKDEFEGVRLQQAAALMRHLHTAYAWSPCGVPIKGLAGSLQKDLTFVVAGDLNTEATGLVYARMREGLSSDDDRGSIPLYSAYTCYRQDAPGTEPVYTTWKTRPPKEVQRTIDYIFHTAHVAPRRLLSIPLPDAIPAERLPCERYPSDHFAIACDFAFCS